jgi:hypothetical protein
MTKTTHALIARSSVAAMALTDGVSTRLVYLREEGDEDFANAANCGFRKVLGVIALSRAGRLEMEPDENLTEELKPLFLAARSDFLMGLAALRSGGTVN